MGNKTRKLSARLLLGIFTLGIAFLNTFSGVFAAVTTPTTINYQGRLLSAANVPLAGNYTFRFSIWNTSDWIGGDTDGLGAINVGSAGYAGWQETHAVTIGATDYGLFNMNLGDTTPFPSFDATTHKNLQVEVKVTGALDTTYEILDPAGTLADVNDRKPLQNQAFSQNADTIDNVDATQFLRSDTSSNLTSGTLATNNGTTLTVNGVANLGDGGDAVAVNSNTWDISAAGVASGFTGLTSTGGIDFSGASAFRMRENADPATNSACATVGELILDTTDKQIQICTVPGVAGAATWVAIDAGSVGGLTSGQFLRSDTSSNLTSGTLTTNNGTTLTVNGVANLGDGGDTIAVNSSSWDISGTGAATGFTGITSAGSIDFSGSSNLRLREVSNPNVNAACAAINELVMNTATNELMRCTGVGVAGVATWTNVDTTGGSVDFEGTYVNDADKTLTTSNGPFTIDTGTNSMTVKSGTAVNLNDNINGNVNIATGTSTGTINMAIGPTAQSVFIASGAGAKTVTLGSTNTTSTTTINGGSGGVVVNSPNWSVDATGNIATTGTANLSGAKGVRIREVANPNVNASCATVNELVMDTATQQLMRCTLVGVAGVATWSNVNAYAKKQSFKVEYDGATISADGANNQGKMTVDNEVGTKRNYYEWSTQQAAIQDMDVVISFKLPMDFVGFTASPMSVDYKTSNGVIGTNKVDVSMDDTAGAPIALAGASNLANAAWTTANITFGGGETFVAGGSVTIRLKLSSTNAGFARISDIVLNYNGR